MVRLFKCQFYHYRFRLTPDILIAEVRSPRKFENGLVIPALSLVRTNRKQTFPTVCGRNFAIKRYMPPLYDVVIVEEI